MNIVNIKRMTNTLTRNLLFGALMLLLTVGALLTTAQGATPTWTVIGDQEYTKNKAVTLTLPPLTGHGAYWSGSTLNSTWNGLKHTVHWRDGDQITGTPNATGEKSVTWECWPKSNSNHKHSMTFKITIFNPPDFGNSTIDDQNLLKNNAMASLSLPTVTDDDVAGTPTYSISPTLPTGLSLDSSTGVLSGTPTVTSASQEYTYTVTDKNGATDTIKFDLVVREAPSFGNNTISDQKYVLNTAITTLTLPEATGGTGTLSYSLSPALPTGLSFNSSTRELKGTPSVTKDETEYTYTVTDSNTPAVSVSLKFNITVDTKPTVSFTEPTGTQKADTFDVTITFSKAVKDFAASDITVTTTRTSGSGDATVALTGSGTSYTAEVTSPDDAKGTVTLEIAADAATLVSNNSLTGPASKATSNAINFDTTIVTVYFTEPDGTQVADKFKVPITFSKSVTGFVTTDITLTSSTGTASFTLSGSGKVYEAEVTSPTAAKGTITLEIAKDAVTDGTRTGPEIKEPTDAISFDTTVATVSFDEPTDTEAADTFDVPIKFSKSVTGFATSDITITTTRTSGTGDATFTLSGSGKDYSVTVTSPTTAKGTVTLEVAEDAVTDGTRTGPASDTTSDAIAFDTTVPSVSYTVPQGVQVTNFDVPIKFSKTIFNLHLSDLTLTTTRTHGTGDATFVVPGVGPLVGSTGIDFTAKITLPANAAGNVNLSLAANSIADRANRAGPASATATGNIPFDTRVPTVSFDEPAGVQVADTFDVPIKFNKSVTGLTTSDITLTSSTGTASFALSGSGSSYTAKVTSPTEAKGTITLAVAQDAVTETGGTRTGPAAKATSDAINFDTTVATVSFNEPNGTQTANTFDVGITFSKSVTDFAKSDITLTSSTGTASFALSGSGASYTATVTSPTAAKGTITLEVAEDAVTDGTRTGPASDTTSNAIAFDTTVATVSFNEPAGTQVADTFDVGITFSKSVTGLTTSDITVTGVVKTQSNFTMPVQFSTPVKVALSGSGTSWTATVTPPPGEKASLILAVAKDAVTDGTRTGPASKTSSNPIAFDTTVATVSFNEPAGTQVGSTFNVGINFSKSVTGLATSDITLTSSTGTASFTLSGSGTSYTATVTSPTAAKGTITLEVAKDAVTDGTRTGPASKATSDTINFDTTVATVSFNEPAGTQTANTFDVGINFSKSVTGLATSDITLTSSTGTASFTLSGSGASYTATITSPTAAKGTITLEVAKDAVTDGTRTGPASKATSDTINFDTTVATVSFNEPAGTQVGSTFNVGINFSKSVTGLATSDITLTSSTGTASFTLSGSGASYTATVTSPTAAKGTITLEVAKDAVTDGTRTGPAQKATSQAINFDTTVATVSFDEPNGTQTANTFDVGIDFSKSVTGFATSDITLTSSTGTASFTLSGSGASYTATITSPTAAKGTITLEVAEDAVTDGYRTGPDSDETSDDISFDTTVATVSFDEPNGVQTSNNFDVGIDFSKSVTGFAASDITLKTTLTSGSGTPSVSLSGSGSDYTATITSLTTAKGTIVLEVAKDAVTDGTRTGPASKAVSAPIAFDTTAPTVTFSEPQGTQTTDTFTVGINFSKSVTGFEAGDLTITTTRKNGSGDASFTLSGSGDTYTATVTSPTAAKGTVKLEIAKNAASDGTKQVPKTKQASKNIPFDTTVPTVSFTEPNGTQFKDTFTVPITFSKSVTGFETDDITLGIKHRSGSGTASFTLSGSGTSYTATVTPPTNASGTITLTVADNAVTDGTRTGPKAKRTSRNIVFDTTWPTVKFNEPFGVQKTTTIDVGIVFSSSVTGFTSGDIMAKMTRSDGATTLPHITQEAAYGVDQSVNLSGKGANYTATVNVPLNATGSVYLVIAPTAATGVLGYSRTVPATSQSSEEILFNTKLAELAFTEPSGTQLANTFDVGITFSKSVMGFETSDIKLITTREDTNGGSVSAALTGSGKDYTAKLTVPANAKGTVQVRVLANSVNDGLSDLPKSPQVSASIAFDTTPPAVSFTAPSTTQKSAFDVGITFSRSVTGFEVGDITLTTTTGTATFTLAGSGTDYTATITPPANAAGSIGLTVKADAATDGVRNGPTTDASVPIDFDTLYTAPLNTEPKDTLPPSDTPPTTIVFSEPSGTQVANTFDVGITFSKSVTGFETEDITLLTTRDDANDGSVSAALTGSGTDYTATITVPAEAKGTVQVQIPVDAANDGISDVPTAVQTSASIAYDTTTPEVRFTLPTTPGDIFDIEIIFSKPVTGFEPGDIILTITDPNSTDNATLNLVGSDTTYTVTVTLPAGSTSSVMLTVKADTVTDGVRNGPAADASVTIDFGTDDQQVDTGWTGGYGGSHVGEIIFNEIYNATPDKIDISDKIETVDKKDWIELKNVGDRIVNLRDWEIGIVTGNGETVQEKKIVTLPSYELLPDHILLILNSAPSETDIAAGIDIYTGRWDEAGLDRWSVARYFTAKKLKLPVEEKYLLTLREKRDTIGTSEAIVDIASTYWPNNLEHETSIWPSHIQKPTGIRPALEPDAAWRRTDKDVPGYIAAAWTASGYQEGRGYDRDAPKETSLGTPGHFNYYPEGKNLPSGPVSMSEIMFATRSSRRAAPQWIEFYNISEKTVDLRGWQLNLEMKTETNASRNQTLAFTFEGVHIGSKQTLLIVTHKDSNSGHFPEHKVYDLSVQHADMPGGLELLNGRQNLLSSAGFSLMLSDANGKVIDKVGNLDGDPKTMDNPTWNLPSGKTVEGHRSSLIRRYKDGEPLPGTEISGWRPATDLRLSFTTYWGHSTDIGNPGYRQGGYLPVSLSHFSAMFTGTEVVLNWTTESELDNAGFNIYRSETANGTFTQINAELIQGAGTTGERQQYEWKDTTAKPNVSYYYRIEDVSFSGVQEQLQTVRMRGQVSASGKQLRTWASLKSDK